ncbi:MAG: DUF4080 domain-containing protein [Lachnospiraceae bacterium]|nr:DUF4080 domain-containing protein [Lachnospiraceae bacterium]
MKKKVLLTAVNAKYIHTCPAVYSLKAYAAGQKIGNASVETAEYTINDRYSDVLAGIMSEKADVIAFSVYIWNVDRVRRLIRDIRKIRGKDVMIWAGGPEATYYPESFLGENGADLCMLGEGEEVFSALLAALSENGKDACCGGAYGLLPEVTADLKGTGCPLPNKTAGLRGTAYLSDGKIVNNGLAAPVDLNKIPFLYADLQAFDHRILYYESSRGCPFSCAYCLSGRERGIRLRDQGLVEKELQFFLDARVPQVKFIDRTFNAVSSHAMHIWQYLKEHDNGVTNFHFEIEADRITDEELELLETLRPGLIQMEIGVQSANPDTLMSVHRSAKLDRIREVTERLNKKQNINLHLDLIAGLPYEDLQSFRQSFNTVYEMYPHQLQLGFLKLLKGTELHDRKEEYGLVCSDDAPYEVLRTKWLSYEEVDLLQRISDRVEEYVNSQGFRRSLPLAEKLFPDAFGMFEALAGYYREHGYDRQQPSVFRRYEIFEAFIAGRAGEAGRTGENLLPQIKEMIRFDQCLHTHASRKMVFTETFCIDGRTKTWLFDHRNPSPVNGEAEYRCPESRHPF